MKTIEITLDGITAAVQGLSKTVEVDRRDWQYPGSWKTYWIYRPQIIELWDEDGNDVTDITVEFENKILKIAETLQEDFDENN